MAAISITTTRVCLVCAHSLAKYTCPSCNISYCTAKCYKVHDLSCTEAFYAAHVKSAWKIEHMAKADDIGHMNAVREKLSTDSEESKTCNSMLDAAFEQTFSSHQSASEEAPGVDEATNLSRMIELAELGDMLSIDSLTAHEKQEFMKALRKGDLSKQFDNWKPWWESKFDHRRSEMLVHDVEPPVADDVVAPEIESDDATELVAVIPAFCVFQREPLCRFGDFTKAKPPETIVHNILETLYAYCHTCRLYACDFESDLSGVVNVLLSISRVLTEDKRYRDAVEALHTASTAAAAECLRFCDNVSWQTSMTLTDMMKLVGNRHLLVDALQHCITALNAASTQATRSHDSVRLKNAARKATFFMYYCNDDDTLPRVSMLALQTDITSFQQTIQRHKGTTDIKVGKPT